MQTRGVEAQAGQPERCCTALLYSAPSDVFIFIFLGPAASTLSWMQAQHQPLTSCIWLRSSAMSISPLAAQSPAGNQGTQTKFCGGMRWLHACIVAPPMHQQSRQASRPCTRSQLTVDARAAAKRAGGALGQHPAHRGG